MTVNGANATINNAVRTSLQVNNAFPALGGRDIPSVNEIRNMVKYNFSAQNRAVTIKDYQSRISLMPGQYGVPFRYGVLEQQNKIQIYILGLDSNGNLTNTSTSTLRDNISNYLADYRMLNDYIQIDNGRVINLSFEIDIFADNSVPQSQITSQIISDVQSYMDINNFQMGDTIYLANLVQTINKVAGVVNTINIRAFNEVGGSYSLNQISQPYIDSTTGEIDISSDYSLYGESMSLFEIKYPQIDIKIRIKT